MNKNFDLIGTVAVEGEITQMNITAKGGVNVVLKDPLNPAILNLSGYAPRIDGIKMINNSMKVVAWGKPNIWSMAGKFSLNIFKIAPLGEGSLKEAYENLKNKLAEEGLFNEERKRPLPEFITNIALLTGKDSAAQSDFLKILQENNAGFNVDFYPVQVQGQHSEKEIISTLKSLDFEKYDCIALIRGGGSLEDLITFNSENLAHTIYSMPIPVIVGVGHEKDESIADFVADIRASTPSQAAYYLTANNDNFINKLDLLTEQAEGYLINYIQESNSKIINYENRIQQTLLQRIHSIKIKIQNAANQLGRLPNEIKINKEKVINYERLLNSLNPKNVLQRGYAVIKNNNGKVLDNIKNVNVNDDISIQLINGELLAKILNKKNYEK
jgi:exodeoxyribonuclease VII large subunit